MKDLRTRLSVGGVREWKVEEDEIVCLSPGV